MTTPVNILKGVQTYLLTLINDEQRPAKSQLRLIAQDIETAVCQAMREETYLRIAGDQIRDDRVTIADLEGQLAKSKQGMADLLWNISARQAVERGTNL